RKAHFSVPQHSFERENNALARSFFTRQKLGLLTPMTSAVVYDDNTTQVSPFCGCFGEDGFSACNALERSRARRRFSSDTRLSDPHFFLYILRTEFPDLWEASVLAGDDHAIVCVPQSTSLPADVTREDAETHVLLPTAAPGEFMTLNGRRVGLVGNELVTMAGFAEVRRVRLLLTEELELTTPVVR
ncbi:unnamed protein product, partial [Phaeothamnion confervicola]